MTIIERTYDGYRVPTGGEMIAARFEVSSFIRHKAAETEKALGFGYVAVPDAPSEYQQLRGAYADAWATKTPLPVSNQHCETTIFLEPEDNIRLRFWHDVHHVKLGLSFNLDDELELATWHCQQMEHAGFSPDSLAFRLLRADFVGQIYLMGIKGRFPHNQRRFVETCVTHGLDLALLDEIRFITDLPTARPGDDPGAGRLVPVPL